MKKEEDWDKKGKVEFKIMTKKRVDTELKLAEIKKHNPTLYSKVVNGSTTMQNAYNEVMSEINKTREYRGRGTKSTKITLEQEFEIIQKRYKPKIDDWIELLKKHFPFTHQDKIK